MMMPCGLVRVAHAELNSLASGRTLHMTVFDASDGLALRTTPGLSPRVAKSRDGKLWLWNVDGIGVVDPSHLPFNKLLPPVHIETLKVNDKEAAPHEGLKLSHNSNDLEIHYTALSFTNPDRVQFRYMLEGKDKEWKDVGTKRYANYGGLPPQNYRFRVMASNNDGVWNEAGAAWNFTIVPAFYQTIWFQGLLVLAGAGFLWLLYRLRLHQMARQFNMRMEERIGERTRIARDLHDTLLQSFHGVLLKFHAVTFKLQDRPEARQDLEGVIEQARQAITEGRDAVQGLRSSTLVNNELGPAISRVGQGLAADQADGNVPEFKVHVEGAPQELAPLVRDEIYRIAVEALRNAFWHAHAKRIEVEIRYNRRQLRMRIRDDGKGIDPKILGEGGRKGHHGLPGMQERAKIAGGKLAVWSKLDSGTELELTVPGSVAYAKSSAAPGEVVGKGTG
jgi:signal transduction histidine kinase